MHNKSLRVVNHNWSKVGIFRSNNNLVKPNGSQATSWVWCSAQLFYNTMLPGGRVARWQGCHLSPQQLGYDCNDHGYIEITAS